MVSGIAVFKCNDCGKRFIEPAIEWYATAYVAPAKCPKCGSIHTYHATLTYLAGCLDLVPTGRYGRMLMASN